MFFTFAASFTKNLGKSVLQLNHIVNRVVKLVNFIRASDVIKFQIPEGTDVDHQNLLYLFRDRW